jgi:predicted amidohydrolase
VIDLTAEAARGGAQFIVFPELILTGYHQELLGDRLVQLALSVEDEPIGRLAQTAGQLGVYLVAGFIEKRRIPGVVYNSIVLCSPDGSVQGTYAKSHLFASEKLHFRQGETLEVRQTPFGVIGPMICMDIGFPEVAKSEHRKARGGAFRLDTEDMSVLLLQSRWTTNPVAASASWCRGELHFIGIMLVDPRADQAG